MSFRLAAREAMKSSFKQHRLGAVIVKGSRVLSTGFNKYGYDSFSRKPTMHAEASAVLKLLKQRRLADLAGAEIYVTRYTKGGRVGLARPCADCLQLLRSSGISKIHYTTNTGNTISESIN
jgi:deoxycytidylate deaminase